MESSESVRAQVSRILASPVFARAKRSSQLLQYLVESTLEGHQDELKEYRIATEAFGKPESFDPRVDTLVRVEAGRLRGRLQLYYEAATDTDEIEISLPLGTYVPCFAPRAPAKSEAAPAPLVGGAPADAGRQRSVWRWAAAAVVAISLGIIGARIAFTAFSTTSSRFMVRQRLSIPGEVLLFPGLSPQGEHVYFSSNRGDGGFRIWKQTWQGADTQVLTPADSDAYDLDVSPDGAWLAYWSNRHGGSIYQQRSSGGEELLVAAGARSPRFSPDGRFIVYWRTGTRGTFGSIFRSGTTPGTHEREPAAIASDFDDAHNPQWMPEQRILLCGTRKTNVPAMEHDIWIVDPEATGASPVKTGILPFLQRRDIHLHPQQFAATSFHILHRNLIFSGSQNGTSRTWLLPLTANWHPSGEPVVLGETGEASGSPSVRDSLLALSPIRTNVDIWSIPLDATGRNSGPPVRLTQGPGEEFFPAMSRDGRLLHYLVSRPARFELWRKDLVTGFEAVAYQTRDMRALRVTPDGRLAFFRSLTGGYPQHQSIFRVEPVPGTASVVCEDCGTPTSVAPEGDFVAYETGSRVTRIAVLDPRSRAKHEVLSHPHGAVMAARISPNGKWLAFELDKGMDGKQIVVAPFRGMNEIPESSWIPVTGDGFSFEPAWGPDGTAIYFISDRLGSRDLWLQRLDPSGRPIAPADLVYRFRNPGLTPLTYSERTTRYIGLTVAKGQALLTLSELSASILLGRLE